MTRDGDTMRALWRLQERDDPNPGQEQPEPKWKVMDGKAEMHLFNTTQEMVDFIAANPGSIVQAIDG